MPTFFAVVKSRSLSGDSRHHQLKTVKENNASGAIKARYSYTPKGELYRVCEGASAASVTTDNLIRGECDLRDYQYYAHDVFGQLTQTSNYHEPSTNPVTHEVFQYSTDSTQWPDLEQEYTLYKYDAAGRRMQVNGGKLHNLQRVYNEGLAQYTYAWQEVIEPHDTQYRYNGEAIYLSYQTGNTIANPNARWLQGAGVDEPLIRYGSDGSITNYHQNGRNSAVLTTSANDGSVVASQQFDAFGNVLQSSGTIEQYGYTGREKDASGLMYYRARYYDSQRGRFIQSDPKGMIDGVNKYAYVRNNPVNRIDPNGTVSVGTNNFTSLNNNYFSSGGTTSQSLFNTNNSFDTGATANLTRPVGGDTSFLTKLGASLPSLPQGVVDFSAGLGDGLLLGLGGSIRSGIDSVFDTNISGSVNSGAGAYTAGSVASFLGGTGRLAYAAVAKGYSIVAASGAAASQFRSQLKNFAGLGATKNIRKPNLSKYADDAALRAGAGRTNLGVNAYGAGVATAGGAGALGYEP